MQMDAKIALDCPYCHKAIYASISWFKQTYSTCPHCEQGLAAGQFETAIIDLEQAMDESIEELLNGPPQTCCGSGKSSCGCGG